MTTALRRRLDSLRRLAERPGTPGEGEAAQAAIGRLLARLGEADIERLVERPEPYVARQPKRTRHQRWASKQPARARIHVGDVIDLHRWCRCGQGHGRYEVLSAIEIGHAGMLRCVSCCRNGGWLTRENFEAQRFQ